MKALENMPELLPGLDVYLEAYENLCYDRPPAGIGDFGHIPWSSIIKWCEANKIYGIDELYVFNAHIRALERADIEISKRKSKK